MSPEQDGALEQYFDGWAGLVDRLLARERLPAGRLHQQVMIGQGEIVVLPRISSLSSASRMSTRQRAWGRLALTRFLSGGI